MKSNFAILIILSFTMNFSAVLAQHRCSSDEMYTEQIAENPAFEYNREQIEAFTARFIENGGSTARNSSSDTYKIPVVFHVVYKYSGENVTDELLMAQLKVLNDDFKRMNEDRINTRSKFSPIAAATNIEFYLATKDPHQQPTTGITRTRTNKNSFGYSGNPVKSNSTGGVDAWPTEDYLNIWVCNLGSGLLGYAQFPGLDPTTDGVVVDYQTLPTERGTYAYGRTLTHEVGHYLNLYHIFSGCGTGDYVNDTPAQSSATYGCPGSRTSCGGESNFENFMDYTDDLCMNMFTIGQAARMRALFEVGGARASLVDNPGGQPNEIKECQVPASPMTRVNSTNEATISWEAVNGAKNYQLMGRINGGDWIYFRSKSNSMTYSKFKSGVQYEWQVRANCGAGVTSEFADIVNFTMPQERIAQLSFAIYPNPATDYLMVEIPNMNTKISQISVRDMLGRSAISRYLGPTEQNGKLTIDLSDLETGLYFVEVQSENETLVRQFTVK